MTTPTAAMTKRLKPVSKKTAAENRKVADERREYVMMRQCVLCKGNATDCHEILGGNHNRHYTKKFPRFWLAVCRVCHDTIQYESKARQFARKLLAEPKVFTVDALTERKPFVDPADVLRELGELL